jgi:YfiH family protein
MTSLIAPDWPEMPGIFAGTTTCTTPDAVLPAGLHFPRQVHGTAVVSADALRAAAEPVDADAVTGRRAGDVCAIRTADCLPVLFCADNGGEIAAAHAGWRGLAAGILENTVAAMQAPAASILAWIGPGISQPNFEVGREVRDAFVGRDPYAAGFFASNTRGRWQADLHGLARRRLGAIGIKAIYGKIECTYGNPGRFHSFRRDPACGRMVSFILLK